MTWEIREGHVLDGVMEADITEEWGRILLDAVVAARRDVEAQKRNSPRP